MRSYDPAPRPLQISPFSQGILGLIQAIAAHGTPRGLPRAVWLARRVIFGHGPRVVRFGDRFRIWCHSDSYEEIVAVCGFVYASMDRLLQRLLLPRAIFIDVGANIGFVSLLACSVPAGGGEVVVHCFEPDPHAFVWLSRNRALNGDRSNMILNSCAVAAAEGRATLTVSARSGWSTMATSPPGGFPFLPEAGKAMVDVTTLDAYCRIRGVSPAVIKIDVEGLEGQVLAGARVILEQARPYLIVEINPMRLAAAQSSAEDLLRYLSLLRYRMFHVDPVRANPAVGGRRRIWHELPEVRREDLVMGEDFDAVAMPEELLEH